MYIKTQKTNDKVCANIMHNQFFVQNIGIHVFF